MTKIKIIKWSNPERWYKNCIGKVFEVNSFSWICSDKHNNPSVKYTRASIVHPSPDYCLFVEEGDFEIVEEKKPLIYPIKEWEPLLYDKEWLADRLNEIIKIINEKLG